MKKYDYDAVILGGGGAGITAAMFALGMGKKIAMIDRRKFGGECTWTGCVPSKALLSSAKAAHTVNSMDRYGLSSKAKISLNYNKVMDSVRSVIENIYLGENTGHFSKLGIDSYEETAVSFSDSHTLNIRGKAVTSAKFFITTGSSPFVPPISGIKETAYHTNETIFSLKKIPRSMVIMGGGPIGVELATAFSRLGVKVTVIEMAPRILIREEEEISKILADILAAEGISIITNAKIAAVKGRGSVTVTYVENEKNKNITAEIFLVAAGRKPNVENLNLEKAGVAFDNKGIKVNSCLQTTAPNIYAAGDVVGPYQFSHMANYQAIIAASNAFLPVNRKADYSNVPWCTFTDPEIARSGLTEKEAAEKYDSIKVFRSEYKNLDRSKTDRNLTGMGKIICDKKGYILGVHIIGERAGELMQEVHLAKSLGIKLSKLDSVIHAYPLYSDLVKNLARAAYIDKIQSNPFVKLIKKIKGKK